MAREQWPARSIKSDDLRPLAPEAVEMVNHYGFYGDDGLLRQWPAGVIVTDADEIAELMKRKVAVRPIPSVKDSAR